MAAISSGVAQRVVGLHSVLSQVLVQESVLPLVLVPQHDETAIAIMTPADICENVRFIMISIFILNEMSS